MVLPDGSLVIYYTGVDATRAHAECSTRPGLRSSALTKQGVAMLNTDSEGNIKEATVDRTKAATGGCSTNMPQTSLAGRPGDRRRRCRPVGSSSPTVRAAHRQLGQLASVDRPAADDRQGHAGDVLQRRDA